MEFYRCITHEFWMLLVWLLVADCLIVYYRLCDDYEAIAEKALTTPSNTEQLMELKKYIANVESDVIFRMEKRLMDSKERLTFLSDYASFSPQEIRLNGSVFMWHGRMPAIFEEHKLIVSEKRQQYEDALKVWTMRFVCLKLNAPALLIHNGHFHIIYAIWFLTFNRQNNKLVLFLVKDDISSKLFLCSISVHVVRFVDYWIPASPRPIRRWAGELC